MKKIIVIGGGAAGAKAASKAKRLNPKNNVELYTRGDIIAYSLCGMPYYIEGNVSDINKLIVKTPQDFINNGIQVFLNSELQEIIPDKNCVLINGNHIFYDELILALGAHVYIPPIENSCAKNVFTLHSLKSAVEIKKIMEKSKKVLIVGGGYIALELCEAFIKNGLDIVLVEINNRLLNDFDEDLSKTLLDLILKKYSAKFEVYFNQKIVKFNVDEEKFFKSAISEQGQEFDADFCVLCTGTNPNVEVAKNAGIEIGTTGAIYVDTKMRTNIKNIYACGDCCQKYCIITKMPTYIGLGTIANKEGRVAAINASSNSDTENFDGILSSTISKFFEYTVSKTGLSYFMAQEFSKTINLEPIEVTVVKKDKASYMPNANELILKLIADKRSGEILGAQSIGSEGNVAQRINTITSALKTRATVDDILHLDLAYAPPFSGSIDPILTAAYKLKEKMK